MGFPRVEDTRDHTVVSEVSEEELDGAIQSLTRSSKPEAFAKKYRRDVLETVLHKLESSTVASKSTATQSDVVGTKRQLAERIFSLVCPYHLHSSPVINWCY